MPELLGRLQEALADRYRIEREIGAGGMATVYLAHDHRHGRKVALKLMRPELSAVIGAERFLAEIKLTANLQHPHILPLFDSGEVDGSLFYVMPFVEGESLRDRLSREKQLPVADAVRIAGEVASALDYAHRHGVIHRDIKPENILLHDGRALIADFGIALAASKASGTRMTETGMSLGTPHYMSPEQAEGRTVDQRSDIFSLGVLLYELATGVRPFKGDTHLSVLSAILRETPTPMTELNPALPPDLIRIVDRCLAKDHQARYPSVTDVRTDLEQLERSLRPAEPRAPGSPARRTWIAAAALALVGTIIGATTWRITRDAGPDPAAGTQQRLVVLPFENLTRNAADDWLANAFAETLTSGLQDVDNLVLVSRDRVVELYRQEKLREGAAVDAATLRRVARALAVRQMVHGNFQRVGNEIRVSARLIAADTGAIVAQETVTEPFAALLRLEDDLARRFAAQLHGRREERTHRAETTSLEAYQAFIDGRTLYAEARFADALVPLTRATTLDDKYAEAWALLAKVHARRAAISSIASGDAETLRREALSAARRAAALQPALYEAQVAVALAFREMENFEGWREAARKAIALNPRSAEAYALLADSYFAGNAWGCRRDRDPRVAEENFRRAIALDPRLAPAYANLSYHYSWLGREADALTVADNGLAILPGNPGVTRARALALIRLKRLDEGEELLRMMLGAGTAVSAQDHLMFGMIALGRGTVDRARQEFDTAVARLPTSAFYLAVARALLDNGRYVDGAAALERAIALEPACAQYAAISPAFAAYRDDPHVRRRLR
jgi:eukaryotic-like serine/threonine-protein kinase